MPNTGLEENGRFSNIKTNLYNKMTCGSGNQIPKDQGKKLGLLNSYHESKQATINVPEKEEVSFEQTGREGETKKQGGSEFFLCGNPNHWAYEQQRILKSEKVEMRATK